MHRLRTAPRLVWRYARRAPGAFLWLAILLATTIFLHRLPPTVAEQVLGSRSTNLHHLAEDPLRVLVSSAFWLDGGPWLFYFAIFNLIHVPAERWLRTWRWLFVCAFAHVGATYISEGVLYWAISHGEAPERAEFALDVGVSYALVGVAAVLVYRLAAPWRYYYLAALAALVTAPMLVDLTFTAVGHFASLLLGLACYPLTRGRGGTWDPAAAWRARRERAAAGSTGSGRSGPS